VRGRIERILDYARVRGYRAGENPARWRGHLDKLLPSAMNTKTREHHAALPYDELPAFMKDLRQQGGNAARALEYLILTAARTGEVIGCEAASEIDLKKAVWTVPAGRMKAGKEHRVPLSPQAIKVVEGQPEGKYLFLGGKEGARLSNMAMLELLKRMGRDGLTVHGFRSTFRDWAAECTSYPGEVCEMALAHAISDKVEAAYPRGRSFREAPPAHARLGEVLRHAEGRGRTDRAEACSDCVAACAVQRLPVCNVYDTIQWRSKSGGTGPRQAVSHSPNGSLICRTGRPARASWRGSSGWRQGTSATRSSCATA
jgi:integrase